MSFCSVLILTHFYAEFKFGKETLSLENIYNENFDSRLPVDRENACIHVAKSRRLVSGIATGGGGVRGQSATPGSEKIAKNGEKGRKSGKIGEKEDKLGRKGKNREGSSTLPLLTDRAGYATASSTKYV